MPATPGSSSCQKPGTESAIGAERRHSGPGSPVNFCDGRTFFATADRQTQLTAGILDTVQVIRPRLAAGAAPGPVAGSQRSQP
jgi:hypothetical protein